MHEIILYFGSKIACENMVDNHLRTGEVLTNLKDYIVDIQRQNLPEQKQKMQSQ